MVTRVPVMAAAAVLLLYFWNVGEVRNGVVQWLSAAHVLADSCWRLLLLLLQWFWDVGDARKHVVQ